MRTRSRVARVVGGAVLASLLDASGATLARTDGPVDQQAAPAPPTFAAAVDVILVDAVVSDRQGRQVNGLTAEDFVVREDGEPQTISSFEAVDLPAAAATRRPPPGAASRWSANVTAESPRRVFIVVMDDAGLGLESATAARTAAKQFLSTSTRPGDLVSLVVPASGLTWWARLPEEGAQLKSMVEGVNGLRGAAPELAGDWEALQVTGGFDPLTQERARLRLDAAGQLPRAMRFPGESDEAYNEKNRVHQEPFLRADSRRLLDQSRDRRRRLFESVSSVLDDVASVKGRKSVLLFSEGFIREPSDPPFRDLVAALRRHNASIYFVNVQRLTSGTAADSREAGDRSLSTRVVNPQESAGAEVAAEETGGFTLHASAALEAGLARVAQESTSYYLLGYSPTNRRRDGKYRRLEVELRRADLKVRARKGYYGPSGEKAAPDRAGKPAADPELEAALAGAVPATEIPLRLTALAQQPVDKGRVRVRVVAEVGLEPVRFEKDGDGLLVATLDVALMLNHVEPGGRQRTPWREWKVKVPPQADGTDVWTSLEAGFDVPSGACQARLAVRDRGSRAVGSIHHGFEVPGPGGWRVSTPILSDLPGEELSRPPRVAVSRSFVAGAPLYCYLEVYPGAKAKPADTPRAFLAYTVVDARGKAMRTQAASPFAVSSAGIPTRLERIALSGLPPGAYELRLLVHDENRGRAQELREPFVLRRPSRPDLAIYRELIQTFQGGDVERAAAGVMEWRPKDLETLAASLPMEDAAQRRAALELHTALAFRLWSNARALEADAQIDIGRALLAKDAPPGLHRDWLLDLGYYQLAMALPAKALPFFEECTSLFPEAAAAWLGAGICHELTAFPDSLSVA